MRDNYFISIKGYQLVDDDETGIQLTTFGSFIKKDPYVYVMYKEYDKDNPEKKTSSVVKVEGSKKITLIRNGSQRTRLTLEEGKRHNCLYDTGMGAVMLGVFTSKIELKFYENGINILAKYSLDMNSILTSINEISIDVKEKNNKDVKNIISNYI